MSLKIIYNNRRYVPLFWTQFFALINLHLFRNALIILIAYRSVRIAGVDSNSVVVFSSAIMVFPAIVFSGTAGQLADKLNKSKLIRLIKFSELLVMLLVSYGFYTDNFAVLLAALFLLGLTSTFFGPLKFGIIPDLVQRTEIVPANGYVVASTFLAIVVGTVAGGVATLQEHVTIILIAAGLGLSALGLMASWFLPPTRIYSQHLRVDWTMLRSTWEILAIVRRNGPIFYSIIGMSWYWLFASGLMALIPIFTKDNLHADKDVVTVLMALFALGIGVGAVLCDKLSFQRVETGLIPLGAIGMSAFGLDLSLLLSAWPPAPAAAPLLRIGEFITLEGGWRILMDVALIALFGGFFAMPLYSFVQQRSDPAFISRVMAGNNIINAMVGVLGATVVTALIFLKVTVPTILLLFALLNLAMVNYLYVRTPEFAPRFMNWVLASVVYRIRVEGREHLPDKGPAVLVCNHAGASGWIIIFGACRRPVRFVLDPNRARGALEKLLLRPAKAILLNAGQQDGESAKPVSEEISAELDHGGLIGIFAGGSPRSGGQADRFPSGIVESIRDSAAPIVPMALSGLPDGKIAQHGIAAILEALFRPRREVVLKIGEPVAARGINAAALERLVREHPEAAQSLRTITSPAAEGSEVADTAK